MGGHRPGRVRQDFLAAVVSQLEREGLGGDAVRGEEPSRQKERHVQRQGENKNAELGEL